MNEMEQLIKRVDMLEIEFKTELKELTTELKEITTKVLTSEKNVELIQRDVGYLTAGFTKLESSVKDSIKLFTDALKKLESKDGEMWNTVIKQIITAIIAAVITAIAMYFK